MKNRYNLIDFEASFRKYLLNKEINKTTIKNYMSDMRHFFGWITSINIQIDNTSNTEVLHFTNEHIELYKAYLLSNSVPVKTINRRLSSLRKFFTYALEENIIKTNPLEGISNVSDILSEENMLDDFKDYLIKAKKEPLEIESYVYDVKRLINYIRDIDRSSS